MSASSPLAAILVRNVLAEDGKIPWSALIESVLDVEQQRELCRKHGLTPKGGFRLEKAPAKVLGPLLAESRDPSLLEVLASEVVESLRSAGDVDPADRADATPAVAAPDPEVQQRLGLLERSLEEARAERDRARDSAARQRERADGAENRRATAEESVVRLRNQVAALEREVAQGAPIEAVIDRSAVHRAHELERELEALTEAEAALRRQLALARTQERELAEQLTELEALVPKGRRRRRRVEEPPEPPKRCFVPYLAPSFYKSLDGKERKSVERAIQAVLLYCTEGPAYPGLEVKQLGGQDLWSMRASLKLRIYFRQRPDGDIDVLALGDREDQPTALRRLKDRD